MKLCKDCKHHTREYVWSNTTGVDYFHSHKCHYLAGAEHPVTGEKTELQVECSTMRLGPCGLEGKFFETRS